MNAINEENLSGYSSENRRYNYESYGLLWKLGLAMDLSKVKLGLTVTTPRINVYGKGSTLFEDYLVGVDTTGDGNRDDYFVYDIQNDLDVTYKSPWAVGLGLGIPLQRANLHFSAEWYSNIPSYELMSIEPFLGQSTGDTISFVLMDELNSVINFGFGLEWNLSDKLSAYASVATDYSAVPQDLNRFTELHEETDNSVFEMDFYQLGAGFSINTKAVEITAGATYRSAQQEFESSINFPDEQGDNNEVIISKMRFNQWRFILGFSFPFADKLAKSLDGGGVD